MRRFTLERLVDVATALSTEKNTDRILERILDEAMELTGCDGGTVYVRDGDYLRFHTVVTRSKGVRLTAREGEDIIPPVPMGRSHVCACAALDGVKINIPDVYASDRFDFSGAQRYDKLNGYRTCSMLVIPMEDEKGTNIGILQLINAEEDGKIVPFDPSYEATVSALASLASVSLNNNMLARAVYDALHSFVEVMVDAVDARTSYNANHTRSMARYAEKFVNWLDGRDTPYRFPDEMKDPFLMSVWLHDIGKLVVPLEVMDKSTRLGARLSDVLHRIETATLMERIRALEEPDEKEDAEMTIAEIAAARDLILRANEADFIDYETADALLSAAGKTVRTPDGTAPLLTDLEVEMITVRRGTLTADEREEMQRHVVYTSRLLGKMQFRGNYSKVPLWASSHHEYLDGSGYPRGLRAGDIPKEVRIITILDVYDALTAEDRPYKPPMPTDEAFSVLGEMASDGKIDAEILALFRESGAWRKNGSAEAEKPE